MEWTVMLKLWGKDSGKTYPEINKTKRISWGRQWLKKGCFANNDDDDDDDNDQLKYIIQYGYQTEYIHVAIEVCNFDTSQNYLEFRI
jgi:hypothetical protein